MPRRHRRKRWLVAIAAVAAAVVLLLVVIQSPPVARRVLGLARASMAKSGIDFRAGRIHYRLIPHIRIVLDDLSLSALGTGAPPFFAARRVVVRPNVVAILRKHVIRLKDVAVADAALRLLTDARGRTNLPTTTGPPTAPPVFIIDRAAVAGLGFELRNDMSRLRVVVPAISVDVRWVQAKGLHRLAVAEGRDGSLSAAGIEAALGGLRVTGWFDNRLIDVESLDLTIGGGSRVAASARIRDYMETPSLEARYDLRLDPMLALRGRPGAPKAAGVLRVTGAAASAPSGATANVALAGESLRVEGLGPVGLNASAAFGNGTLRVRDLRIDAAGGDVRGEADVTLGTSPSGRARLTMTRVDPRAFARLRAVNVPVATFVTADLDGAWTGRLLAGVKGTAVVRFAAPDPAPAGTIPVWGEIRASAAGGTIRAAIPGLSAPGLDFSATGSYDGRAVAGSFAATSPEVARLLAAAAVVMPKAARPPSASGRLDVRGTVSGPPRDPVVAATIEGAGLAGFGLRDVGLDGRLTARRSSIDIESLKALAGGGSVEVSGRVAPGPTTTFDLSARGDRLPLDILPSGTVGAGTAPAGILSFTARVHGSTADPAGSIAGRIDAPEWRGQRLDAVEFAADFTRRLVTLRNLRATSGTGALSASGTFEPESRRFATTASASGFPVSGAFLPGRQDVLAATLDLRASAEGTPSAPSVTADGTLRGVTFRGSPLGDIAFDAKTANEVVTADVKAPAFSGEVRATFAFRPPRPFDARLTVTGLTLEKVAPFVSVPAAVTGASVSASIHAAASLDRTAETLTVSADVSALSAEIRSRPLRAKGPFTIAYGPAGISVAGMEIDGTGFALRASGSLPRRGAGGAGLAVDAAVDVAALGMLPGGVTAAGTLSMDAGVVGSIERPVPSGDISLSGASLQLAPERPVIQDGVLAATLRGGLLDLRRLSFGIAGGTLSASGSLPVGILSPAAARTFPVPAGTAGRFGAKLVEFNLVSLMEALGRPAPETFAGLVAGDVSLSFPRPALDAVTARITFPTLDLAFYGYRITATRPVDIAVGGGRVDVRSFQLTGPEFRLGITGGMSLAGTRDLDVKVDGAVGFRMLGIPGQEMQVSGSTAFGLAARGPAAKPVLDGTLTLRDVGLHMMQPNIALDGLSGQVAWTGGRAAIAGPGLRGSLNGGTFTITGTAEMPGLSLGKAEVGLAARGVSLEIPPGLLTQSDADLRFTSDGLAYALGGKVSITQGEYRQDFDPATQIAQLLRRGRTVSFIVQPSAFQTRTALSVRAVTAAPIVVENNLARAEVTADVTLTGTPLRMGMTGQAALVEGSEITLNQRKFLIQSGRVSFVNAQRIVPDADVNASTQLKGYTITLTASGTPDDLTANLSSDPPLSEPSIATLLLTGRIVENPSTSSYLNVAGNVGLAFLTQSITGRLGNLAASALGLQSVQFDTGLISPETQPTARVSVTESLARDLDLTLSMNLRDAQNRAWLLDYNPNRFLDIQAAKADNNVYGAAFQREVRFGPGPAPLSATKRPGRGPVVRAVNLTGNTGIPRDRLYAVFRKMIGKPFDFFTLWDDRQKARDLFVRNGRLQFALETRNRVEGGATIVDVRARGGPVIRLDYVGAPVPRKLRREIESRWAGGLFSPWAVSQIAERLRAYYVGRGFYQTTVRASASFATPGVRRFRFEITPGPFYRRLDLVFTGNASIPAAELRTALKAAGMTTGLITTPRRATDVLNRYYQSKGWLAAKVGETTIEYRPERRQAVLTIAAVEGPLFHVAAVRVTGARALDPPWVRATAGLGPGDVFRPAVYNDIEYRLESAYARLGFNQARAMASAVLRPDGTADVAIAVTEGGRDRVAEIRIVGNEKTKPDLIRDMLLLKPGSIIDPQKMNESRKYLMNLGVFTRVDLVPQPLPAAPVAAPGGADGLAPAAGADPQAGAPAQPGPPGPAGPNLPNLFRVEVTEIRPYRLLYGLHYSTDTGPGVTGEITNFNALGRAYLVGARARLDRDFQDIRLYGRSPYFLDVRDFHTDVFLFAQHYKGPLRIDLAGVTVQQQLMIRRSEILTYNATYQWERPGTSGATGSQPGVTPVPTPSPIPLPGILRYLDLNAAYTLDTRNDILSSRRGLFLSQSVEYVPRALGSTLRMSRTYSQAFTYLPLGKLVYAAGLRLGLGWSSAGLLAPSKVFVAGGGNTIRGFARDTLGPKDAAGNPTGGNAVLILNNELRFPIKSPIGGVVFLDAGNVYARVSDIRPLKMRTSAGVGIRYDNPYVVVSLDFGFALARKPGDKLSVISFTLGQAF